MSTSISTELSPDLGATPVVVIAGGRSIVAERVGRRLTASGATIVDVAATSTGAALAGSLAGSDVLVVLGPLSGPDLDGTGGARLDAARCRQLLAAAADAGVRQLVVMSTAMVYGAWPDNPVPLTEDAPLRPDAALAAVVERAEIERMAAAWRDDHDGATAAVLRPVVVVAPERSEWFRRSPWRSAGLEVGDDDPPRQFLHVDDLVTAVDTAVRQRLDGPFNVAPDGWLATEAWRELSGPRPRLRVPGFLARRVADWRFRLGLSHVPPDVLPYVTRPWVVANDRLKDAGWSPEHTNEEAYVIVDRAGPLRSLSPQARQELSLAAVGAGALGLVAGAALLLRRRRSSKER